MSTNSEMEAPEVCASCGMAAINGMTLKKCACNLVKYCTVDCQKAHRAKHKKSCRMRLTEMRDESLLKQPDIGYLGKCSICFLPLPIDERRLIIMGCCGKIICGGCGFAYEKRKLEPRCTCCGQPVPNSLEEHHKRIMERVKKNDSFAMTQMGKKHAGKGDYRNALEYYTKAAALGDVSAHCCLGILYFNGDGVEKDMKKALPHLEQAAIGGHPDARGLLALYEMDNGRFKRASKHYIIAASLGCIVSLSAVKNLFVQGIVSEDDYAAALRAHEATVNETKSTEREEAEAYFKKHARPLS